MNKLDKKENEKQDKINFGNMDDRFKTMKKAWASFKKRPVAVIGLMLVLGMLLIALFAPLIAPHDPYELDFSKAFLKPGEEPGYLLGTDELGRDVLSRIIYGSRISIGMGVGAVLLGAIIGIPAGLVAGYYDGSLIDNIIMRAIDVLLAFPSILLAIVIVSILGPGETNALIALSLWSIPGFARITRSEVLSIKGNEYVEASVAMGAKDRWIIIWHLLPNVASQLIIWSTLNVSATLLVGAGLGFLGLGAQPPSPEWGALLSSGRQYITRASHLTTYPGLAILILAMGLNLLGDGLRDVFDPRLND